jgi:asparagine synthase (glutamine-hydrolysing)
VTTFTIGYEGKEDYNEFQYARRIAARYKTDHHETLITQKEAQEFLPLLVRLQDEPIADNVCIPLYFLAQLVRESGTTVVQVGEGADENFLGYWWCEHYRQKYDSVYRPSRAPAPAWRRWLGASGGALVTTNEDQEIAARARAGQELFWGGAVCWWGERRRRLTPDPTRFRQEVDCPIDGLLPDAHRRLDSHSVVAHYVGDLSGHLVEPEVLQKIPFLEMKIRLSEHLLMRVDKLTMAHAVEARVPFLDHEVVEFASRLPPTYKLRDGIGKWILKRAAEPFLDAKTVYRKKQGFGAPMEEWWREGDFGQRALAAFERSEIRRSGLLDNDYVVGLLRAQVNGSAGHSFQLWTVLNAVLWHEAWIAGRKDCF